ncbi:hypothetical protein [Allorhizobium ampelinum]|nr:hypothetical protein [Allorhizobium ampelinum]
MTTIEEVCDGCLSAGSTRTEVPLGRKSPRSRQEPTFKMQCDNAAT